MLDQPTNTDDDRDHLRDDRHSNDHSGREREPTARLTAAQVAQRLGVKLPTVYAYVSRGLIQSERSPDGRASTFDPDEVERLARRGRPRRSSRAPTLDIEIETSLTNLADGRLRYRGHDAVTLADSSTFEAVAELLWLAELQPRQRTWPGGTILTAASDSSAPRGTKLDQLRTTVALAAAHDPLAADLRPEAVAETGRRLIATMVCSLTVVSRRRPPRLRLRSGDGHGASGTDVPDPDTTVAIGATVASQLAVRLGTAHVDAALVGVVNTALCLLADHELAASTLAARVAASARADPYGVISAGFGPFSGALHGTASRYVRTVLERALVAGPAVAIDEALRLHGTVPGFGHGVYPHGDPRAVALLDQLRSGHGHGSELDTVEAVLELAGRRTQVHPNVDFALGSIGLVHALDHDAGDALFGVARSAGWLAHAIEEYQERPLRFRPRARYVGVTT